jgi:hypothetical protein
MATQPVPASSQSDGRWRITYTDSAADPLSAADLELGDQLTYSFTPDGFNWTTTQATVTDGRLTLDQDLSRPGKKTETLEVRYVDSADVTAAAVILAEGTEGFLTVRRGIAEDTVWTAAQKADVITFIAGAQRPDAPVENGVDTISQTLYITSPTQRGAAITA